MSVQKGDTYECPECGCTCEITEAPAEDKGGEDNLSCCCGNKMEKKK